MMNRYNAYIYGAGYKFNKLSAFLPLYKEKIQVLGVVTTFSPSSREIGGYKCFGINEVNLNSADIIIIAIENWRPIFDELMIQKIDENKIIRSTVFELPYFDIDDYMELKKSKISILSNYCLGGMIYRDLGLRQMSPTVNGFCTTENYFKFIENYEKYLSFDIEPLTERYCNNFGEIGEMYGSSPRGIINDEIEWIFNHDVYVERAIENWNRKRKLFNPSNVAVIKTIFSDEDAYRFEELDIEKRVGFYYKDLGLKHVFFCPEWSDQDIIHKYSSCFTSFVNDRMTSPNHYYRNINWIRFLLGKDNFIRS